jgi:hypothetical protein
MQNVLHNTEIELDVPEKFCHKCGECLPATDEYFQRRANGRFYSPCKLCMDEQRLTLFETKPCCVPGCKNPRYHWRYARCWEHRAYLQVNPHPRVYKRKGSV